MADYSYDEEYYDEEPSGSVEQDLVEALDAGVQKSVNTSLVKAIAPLKRHLNKYALQQGWIPAPKAPKPTASQSTNPHADDFALLADSLAKDQSNTTESDPSGSPYGGTDNSTDQDTDLEELAPPAKKKKKEHHSKVLTFEPADIIHANSTAWLPSQEVADYVQSHLRRPYDKDVRARLRSECPRPDLTAKVADTSEVDPTMLTYLRKYSRDPKKGIDQAWRSCQDKLLDLSGPLTKILEMGYRAKESKASIDPDELICWAQRAICQLGNANCAISNERRCSILLKLDPKLAELATSEAGPMAQGLLFGQPFLKELTKFVSAFSGLDKAQESLKKSLPPGFHQGRTI